MTEDEKVLRQLVQNPLWGHVHSNTEPEILKGESIPGLPDTITKDDNYYIYNDLSFKSLEEVLHIGYLEMCGCGNPELNLEFIANGLKLIDKHHKDVNTPYLEQQVQKEEYFGDKRQQYFFFYMMDKLELTEHGGSVPGWLDSEGVEFLSVYDYYVEHERDIE